MNPIGEGIRVRYASRISSNPHTSIEELRKYTFLVGPQGIGAQGVYVETKRCLFGVFYPTIDSLESSQEGIDILQTTFKQLTGDLINHNNTNPQESLEARIKNAHRTFLKKNKKGKKINIGLSCALIYHDGTSQKVVLYYAGGRIIDIDIDSNGAVYDLGNLDNILGSESFELKKDQKDLVPERVIILTAGEISDALDSQKVFDTITGNLKTFEGVPSVIANRLFSLAGMDSTQKSPIITLTTEE